MNKDLGQLSTAELGKLFPIIISDPNPKWKEIYQIEKTNIIKLLGLDIVKRIEHIGSTAIPNLKSKPTIDILLEINDNVDANRIIELLKKLEYHFISKPENPPPHMMFAKGYSKEGFIGQTYHIHVRFEGNWNEIIFRDYLINNPEIAKEYSDLKLELAKKYKNNREAYTEGKTDFIKKVINKSKKIKL